MDCIRNFCCFNFRNLYLLNEFPADFLQEEEIIEELNKADERIPVEAIQDIIFIDDKHVFVPFISKDNDYCFSLWKWKNGKWHLSEKTVTGFINLVKLKENDPSSYYFVWNFPDLNISTIKLFLLKERNYRYSEGYTMYQPRIQMEQSYSRDTSYGIIPLSGEMLNVYEELVDMAYNDGAGDIFSHMNQMNNDLYFTWLMYSHNGELIDLNVNGYSYNGNVHIATEELFWFVSMDELDYPNSIEEDGDWQNTNKK